MKQQFGCICELLRPPDDADRHVISVEPFEGRLFCPERCGLPRFH